MSSVSFLTLANGYVVGNATYTYTFNSKDRISTK